MKNEFIREVGRIFECKETHRSLKFTTNSKGEILNFVSKGFKKLKINSGIPYFSEQNNYASNFGFQWNEFKKTQLDSYNGTNISENSSKNSRKKSSKDMIPERRPQIVV